MQGKGKEVSSERIQKKRASQYEKGEESHVKYTWYLPLLRVEGSPECPESLEWLPTGVLAAGLGVDLVREKLRGHGKARHRGRVRRHQVKVRVGTRRHRLRRHWVRRE